MKSFKNASVDDVFAFLSDIVQHLDGIFGRHQYMLIGSYARDIYISVEAGHTVPRSTQDVDFSAVTTTRELYLQALERVGRKSGSTESNKITCRVINGNDVDILPFGEIAPNGVFTHKEAEWDVLGHREAFEYARIYPLAKDNSLSVKIPRLESLLTLKIIAWGMRRLEGISKDAQDFQYLLHAGVEILGTEEIWSEKNQEILDEFEYNPDLASAFLLGRTARESLDGMTLRRCQEILGTAHQQEEFFAEADNRAMSLPLADNAFENYQVFLKGLLKGFS